MINSSTPNIIINSAAHKFIIDQIMRSDVGYETGGILLGREEIDSHIVITHATPTGPEAQMRSAMYGLDVEFQQGFIDVLSGEFNIDYIGTWHKHPRTHTTPSPGDHQMALSILRDPDYPEKLVLPIGTVSKKGFVKLIYYYIDYRMRFMRITPKIVGINNKYQHRTSIKKVVYSYLGEVEGERYIKETLTSPGAEMELLSQFQEGRIPDHEGEQEQELFGNGLPKKN